MSAPQSSANAAAWGLPQVMDFFTDARSRNADVYPSEWFFLSRLLKEGMTVLDVGCAQGGFASVLSENLKDFRYTGVDVNENMVAAAQNRFPQHKFLHVAEGDLSALEGETFDLALVLGILHLHEKWRDTLAGAWAATGKTLLYDLRESDGPTIEDKSRSYFKMDFHGGDARHSETRLPYIIVNAGEALGVTRRYCPGAKKISRYGYVHPVSGAAVTPVAEVLADVWCVER